jgi:hypothetical protein
MSSAMSTFANQLRHFARSVDIVDDETFDRIRQLIYRYVKNELGASYFELMQEQTLEGDPGLRMFWSSEERDHTWRLRRQDGSFSNLVTLAFAQEQPLWVVDGDKKALGDADKLEDDWSHNTNLPTYEPMVDGAVRTLVVLPLRRKRPLGVCYFESSQHMGITDVAKTELLLLAESLAILFDLYEINRAQSQMTSSAIFELHESLEAAKFPKLTRPHFFLAFPNRADPAVTRVISEVLDEFSDRLDATDWTQITESGNINAQIARDIMRAGFGICYFSEPVEGDHPEGTEYVDNANVIFEAGMLHARTGMNGSGDGGDVTGWIPMRERASPPAPFDFAAERILYTPRLADGRVNEPRLHEDLKNRISKLLGEE